MAGPIDSVYPDGSPVAKSSVRGDDKTGHRRNMASVTDVRNAHLAGQTAGIYVRALQTAYDLDPSDTTTADDGGTCIVDADGGRFKIPTVGGAPIKGFLYGLKISNNASDATNDIDIASGEAANSSNVQRLILLSGLTKRLDANWAAGSNQGGRYSGAAIANTTYHVYLIAKAAGADVDIYMDPSAVEATALGHLQAETGGSAYVYLRRIASIPRESGSLIAISQRGDEFLRTTAADVNDNNPGTSAVLKTLSVPTGIHVRALCTMILADLTWASATDILFTSPDQADTAPGTIINDMRLVDSSTTALSIAREIRTNTNGQIRYRLDQSTTDHYVQVKTHGWIDRRGRDG